MIPGKRVKVSVGDCETGKKDKETQHTVVNVCSRSLSLSELVRTSLRNQTVRHLGDSVSMDVDVGTVESELNTYTRV